MAVDAFNDVRDYVESQIEYLEVVAPPTGELIRHMNRVQALFADELGLPVPSDLVPGSGVEPWGGVFGKMGLELLGEGVVHRLLVLRGDERADLFLRSVELLKRKLVGERDLGLLESTPLGEIVSSIESNLKELGLPLPARKRLVQRLNEAQDYISRDLRVPQVRVANVPADEPFVFGEEFRPEEILSAKSESSGRIVEVLSEAAADRRGVQYGGLDSGFPSRFAGVGGEPFLVFSPGNATATVLPCGFERGESLELLLLKRPTRLSVDAGDVALSKVPFDGVLPSWAGDMLRTYVLWMFVKDDVRLVEFGRDVVFYRHFERLKSEAFQVAGHGEAYVFSRPVIEYRDGDLFWRDSRVG